MSSAVFPPPSHRLTPTMRDVLDRMRRAGRPPLHTMSVGEAREAYRLGAEILDLPRVPLARIEEMQVPARDGHRMPARLYAPGGAHLPVLLYLHGGGFTIGGLDTHDSLCRQLALQGGAAVLSVDYRLAPENRFPAAVDDAFAATGWVASHARELELDPARLCVAGDSAGGALAAGVALRARDAGGPPLRAQLIFYASCNYPGEKTPSALEYANGPILSSAAVEYLWHLYLADPARDQHHPWASPIRARDHRSLPPAFVASAECDPTRDDCEAYAAKLASAGVPTRCKRYAGMPHGFVSWLGLVEAAQTAIEDAVAWLARHAASEKREVQR